MHISIPWGRTHLTAELPDHRVRGILRSRLESYVPAMGQRELVEAALASPIGSQRLEVLAAGKKNIVLIASDHTRPVPSKVLVPPMLEAIRRGVKKVIIMDGRVPHSILMELLTDEGAGTMIRGSRE